MQLRDVIDLVFYRSGEPNLFKELRLLSDELRAGRIQEGWMSGLEPGYKQASKGNELHSRLGFELSADTKSLVLTIARADFHGGLMEAVVNAMRRWMCVKLYSSVF